MIHIAGSIGQINVVLELYHLFRFDTNKDGQISISDVEFSTNLPFFCKCEPDQSCAMNHFHVRHYSLY